MENKIISQQRRRNQINDHIAERSLNDNGKIHFKALKISVVSGNSNGLSISGHINGVPCNMIIDTGANVTIIRKDLAQQFKDKLIWTPSCVTLQTASDDKMGIYEKLNVNITFGSAAYHHSYFRWLAAQAPSINKRRSRIEPRNKFIIFFNCAV
ncbi:hypothetical protein X975_26945, partial [Stegodyphus mimosarum]